LKSKNSRFLVHFSRLQATTHIWRRGVATGGISGYIPPQISLP